MAYRGRRGGEIGVGRGKERSGGRGKPCAGVVPCCPCLLFFSKATGQVGCRHRTGGGRKRPKAEGERGPSGLGWWAGLKKACLVFFLLSFLFFVERLEGFGVSKSYELDLYATGILNAPLQQVLVFEHFQIIFLRFELEFEIQKRVLIKGELSNQAKKIIFFYTSILLKTT